MPIIPERSPAMPMHGTSEHVSYPNVDHVINVDEIQYGNARLLPRIPGRDFPFFQGQEADGDPKEWLAKCENHFRLLGASEAQKLSLAVLHLRGEAGKWYDKNMKRITCFRDLGEALSSSYKETKVKSKLMGLKQTGSVVQYQKEFLAYMGVLQAGRSVNLDESAELVSWFIKGLKAELQPNILKFKPKTVSGAVLMAKLAEEDKKSFEIKFLNLNFFYFIMTVAITVSVVVAFTYSLRRIGAM